ncbi:MAG: HlyD family efflux transporter periplasmic adaptor subunit [Bacteroidales bacterium]|jgi:multidrug efflux pump subunit AcrA (membrane-fusion protein)
MARQHSSFLLVLIIPAVSLVSCRNQKGNSEKAVGTRTPVTIINPVFRNISETIEFPATSSYIRKNIIRSSTTGLVESVTVVPGDYVSRGKLLFSVKTREASALNTFQNDTSLSFKGVIKINSQEEGIVSSVSHQCGDYVQEGDELAVVSDQSSLVFLLEVPAEQAFVAEKAKRCTLILPDNTLLTGVITGRLPEMNVQSQTVSYTVKPETVLHVPQNLIVQASIIRSVKTNATLLPKAAVLGNETLTEFWVMKLINDTTAVKVDVSKGIEKDGDVEITDPQLHPEDKIVLTGNYGLPDTALVAVSK